MELADSVPAVKCCTGLVSFRIDEQHYAANLVMDHHLTEFSSEAMEQRCTESVMAEKRCTESNDSGMVEQRYMANSLMMQLRSTVHSDSGMME